MSKVCFRPDGLKGLKFPILKDKLSLLNGVIHGTSYFCSCGDCDLSGKALTAKAFENHAHKGKGHGTHNPNHHIIFRSSTISLFEACHMLKDAKNEAMEQAIYDKIRENAALNVSKSKAVTTSYTRCDNKDCMQSIEDRNKCPDVMRRLDKMEERLEKMQLQVHTLDKSVDCLCNEMVKYQKLFEELSKTLGKFVNM